MVWCRVRQDDGDIDGSVGTGEVSSRAGGEGAASGSSTTA